MKKIIWLLMCAAFITGCTAKTEYGECIGIQDDEKPELKYKVNTGNVILGVVFVETAIVPIVVLLDQFKCPIAKKQPS